MKTRIYSLPLSRRDANALLHLIAAASSDGKVKPEQPDVTIGGYLADRIVRIMHNEAEPK